MENEKKRKKFRILASTFDKGNRESFEAKRYERVRRKSKLENGVRAVIPVVNTIYIFVPKIV